MLELNKIYNKDCLLGLKELDDNSVDCCVSSPPYWGLRDYGVDGQIGLEQNFNDYIGKITEIYKEVFRVLKPSGTCWLNLGDTYSSGSSNPSPKHSSDNVGIDRKVIGIKPKNLLGIPWRVAFSLQSSGWFLRQDIIWHKPNVMPESVTDRCTKSHEYLFLLTKSSDYYFDSKSIREDISESTREAILRDKTPRNSNILGNMSENGVTRTTEGLNNKSISQKVSKDLKRNKRDVWSINTKPFKGAHFAVMPEALVLPCVLSGCPDGGVVLDPFMGSGTVAVVAKKNNRKYIGFELNSKYIEIANSRIDN